MDSVVALRFPQFVLKNQKILLKNSFRTAGDDVKSSSQQACA